MVSFLFKESLFKYLNHSDCAISHLKAKSCSGAGLLTFLPKCVCGKKLRSGYTSDCVPVEPCLPDEARGVNPHETSF